MKKFLAAPLALVALALVLGAFTTPTVQAQEELVNMWVVPRGQIMVLRLYDEPNPLGTTMATIPAGMEIKVHVDQMYNKYWYKTEEGYYAHRYYLTDVDPAYDPEAERAQMSQEDLAREQELLEKYNDIRIVNAIMAQAVPQVSWTMEMVIDSWGNPDDRQTIEKPMGSEYTWIYYEPPGGINRTVIKFDHRRVVINVATDR